MANGPRLRRAAAGATAGVLLGLVACDVWVAGVRAWWDRRSFTSCVVSSLLVLGVTVLIIDEVLARRRRQERAVSVAVQALIVYAQALRSRDAALSLHKLSSAPAAGAGDGTVAGLMAGRAKMDAGVSPLAARLADEDRASLDAAVDLTARRPVPAGAPAPGG